jgi:hypothetical protein
MLEATAGTINYPTVAGKSIVLSGNANFSQSASFTDSTEARNSRSAKSRFQDLTPAGTWSFSTFLRPSGTAGNAPDANHLLQCCFGTEVAGGGSVTYIPAVNLSTVTMVFKYQDVAFGLIGCTVNELRMQLTNKGAINCSWSGGFMQMATAGSSNGVTGTAGGNWLVLTGGAIDYAKYSVGMRIEVAASGYTHNGVGSGYTIGSMSLTNYSMYVTPTLVSAVIAADTVRPWIPSINEVGTAIECRTGICSFDTTAVALMGMEVAFSNGIRYLEDEITTSGYPSAFAADNRKITGSTNIYLRGEDLQYFYKARNNTNVGIVMSGGSGAGNLFTLTMPYCKFSVPPIAGEMEKQLSLEFQALASGSEDEITLKFT